MKTKTEKHKPIPAVPSEAKAIPGFSGYFVTPFAVIYSTQNHTIRILHPGRRTEDGRARYTLLGSDKKYYRRYASHFVLLAFKGPRPAGMEACHEDGNCLNDAADNLRWDTPTANKADMIRHGTRQKGRQINTVKLNECQVREIRQRRLNGERLKPLAKAFGVTEANISYIAKGKSWSHV